jgi:hypothetical protein
MRDEDLVNKLKEYCYEFSFDGINGVYNPFTLLYFFTARKFRKFLDGIRS